MKDNKLNELVQQTIVTQIKVLELLLQEKKELLLQKKKESLLQEKQELLLKCKDLIIPRYSFDDYIYDTLMSGPLLIGQSKN